MLMFMFVGVRVMLVLVVRCVMVLIAVLMAMGMAVFVVVTVSVLDMNIEFYARDARLLTARNMEVITIQRQLFEFLEQRGGINSEVNQRADEHVAADTAEHVEIQGLHCEWPK